MMMPGFSDLRHAAAVRARGRSRAAFCLLVLPLSVASAETGRPAALADEPRGPGARIARSSRLLLGATAVGPMQEVGWGGGESMTFALAVAGVEGGRGAISVGSPRTLAGRRSLKLRGLSESSELVSVFRRLRQEDVVHLDLAGLLPLEWSSDRLRGDKRRRLLTTYGPPLTQEIQQNGRTLRRQRQIPAPVLDPLSALYLLRSTSLPPGARMELRVLGGLSLYRVELRAHGNERIVVGKTPRETLRIDGVAHPIGDDGRAVPAELARKFSLWLGSGRARVPYRVRGDTTLGPAEATLTSYRGAASPLRVRVSRIATR